MDEIKTLPFDWEFGQEEVALVVSSYADNGSLYVGLYCKEDGFEPFGDLTVNLRENNLKGRSNAAFIDHDFSRDKLRFIKRHKLGTVLPEKGYSGFCEFSRVAFDLERLKEFDREGVERYLSEGPVQTEGAALKRPKKREQAER